MWYEIFVFGLYIDDIESVGGWQLFLKTYDKEYARNRYIEYCEMYGYSHVAAYVNDKLYYFE